MSERIMANILQDFLLKKEAAFRRERPEPPAYLIVNRYTLQAMKHHFRHDHRIELTGSDTYYRGYQVAVTENPDNELQAEFAS